MKVLAVIFLHRPHNSKLPRNQVRLENPHKSVGQRDMKNIMKYVEMIPYCNAESNNTSAFD
jgi:hypothetical protein